MDRRKGALRVFFGMLTNTFKRQQLWAMLPMDPSAWYFLLTAHHSELISSQTSAIESSQLIMGPSKPVQGKGVSSLDLLPIQMSYLKGLWRESRCFF